MTRYVPGAAARPHVADARARSAPPTWCGSAAASARRSTPSTRADVVHRDLKPGNVLLLDGDPVVIDFGIAHVADDVRLTSTGLVMGTPGYLSPEVVEGAPVTEATDWWGWAATSPSPPPGARRSAAARWTSCSTG